MKDVLDKFPGMTKDDLQYWDKKGFISPAKISKRKIERRDYTPAFDKIKLMYDFAQTGMKPEEASKQADTVLNRGNISLQMLRKDAFNILYSGNTSLKEKFKDYENAWEKQFRTTVKSYASPMKREFAFKINIDDFLSSVQLRYTPKQLKIITESCLDVLDDRVDAIVGTSENLSILAGALSIMALERYDRNIQPFLLCYLNEKFQLLGGREDRKNTATLITEVINNPKFIIETIHLLRFRGNKILQVISLIEPTKEEVKDKLSNEKVKLTSLLTKQDFMDLWEQIRDDS